MRPSSVRRMPAPISGWRRRISSNTAIARMPGADFRIGTISPSQTSAKGSGRRRPRGAFFCEGRRRIILNAVAGCPAEAGLGGRNGGIFALSVNHIQPHLVVGDVKAGQRLIPQFRDESDT
jgi:hypothetical protein